jgi:endonuclease/exonuclease/phosphatase (EEP) superfamily protein YafD
MEVQGIGEMNENGEMLTNFCANYDLVIGGTLFPQKTCHKITWVSPDHNTENQIDHIDLSRKFRRSLTDVRNNRGADINSDHHFVVADFQMRIVGN